jgi:hypothetical protein
MKNRSVKSAILVIGSTAVFSATAAAQEAPAQVTVQQQSPPVVQTAPAPAPQERETVTEKGGPSTGLLTSGFVVFGVSYGAAAIAGATSDTEGDNELFVPFAGPWTALNNHDGTSAKVLLVTDGVFQALGGLLVIDAFLNPREVTTTKAHTAEVQVSPAVSPEFLGLAATGRF